jgi:hypothetical protein
MFLKFTDIKKDNIKISKEKAEIYSALLLNLFNLSFKLSINPTKKQKLNEFLGFQV